MNTNFLAIDNTPAPKLSAAPVLSKPTTSQNTDQFAARLADSPPPTNTGETATTDNTFTNAQSEVVNKPPQEFSRAVRKEITIEEPPDAQANKKSKGQNPTLRVAPQPDMVQSWLTEHSLTVEQSKDGVATKVMPKAGYELARLLISLKADKFPPGAGQTTKPAENKHPLTTGQGRPGLKDILPDVSRAPLAADTAPGKSKNADKIQIPNKGFVAAKLLPSRKSGKELVSEAPVNRGGKTPPAGEKPAIADKPAGSVSPKTPLPTLSNDGLPTAQSKPSGASQIPSELSDGKPRQQADNPLLDNSILQKLNSAQVQISTNQTKNQNPNSPASNNSSNPDAKTPEQILYSVPPHNAQPTIAERFFDVSAQSARTADGASPNDVSTSISEQIQTSILQSSSRLGGEQITIRLNPPELGKVFIKFQEQQDQITGLLEVSKIQTRAQIQQALPQIIRNLADSGIQIKRLEVVLVETDQQEQHSFRDQSLQDGWAEQQAGAEGNNPNNTSQPANPANDTNSSYAGLGEPQESEPLMTDNSINMLI